MGHRRLAGSDPLPAGRQMQGGLTPFGFRELLAWMLGRRTRFSVAGFSMSPALVPGDQLLVQSSRSGSPQAGDWVVVNHPIRSGMKLIKQVERVLEDGRLFVVGLNKVLSSDSRSFGAVVPEQLLGRVTSVLKSA